MKSFLQEYGLVLLSIIGVAFFFFVWAELFHGDEGIDVVYKTWSPDTLALRGSNAIEKDSVATASVPYFKVDDSTSSNFILTSDTFRKSDALAHVDAFYKGAQIADNDITVLVYKYKPIMTPTDSGNINGHVKMTSDYTYNELLTFHESGRYTEVFATDKYGNYLYDVSGKHIIDEQPIYEISKAHELTDTNYIDVSNVSEKYLVVYRVTKDSLKAECKKFFIKKSTSVGNQDPLEGFEKIEFDYNIDEAVQPLSVEGGEFEVTHGYSGGGGSSGGNSDDKQDDSSVVDDSDDSEDGNSDDTNSDDSEDDSSGDTDSDSSEDGSTDGEDSESSSDESEDGDSDDSEDNNSDDSEDNSTDNENSEGTTGKDSSDSDSDSSSNSGDDSSDSDSDSSDSGSDDSSSDSSSDNSSSSDDSSSSSDSSSSDSDSSSDSSSNSTSDGESNGES